MVCGSNSKTRRNSTQPVRTEKLAKNWPSKLSKLSISWHGLRVLDVIHTAPFSTAPFPFSTCQNAVKT
jgi:hypothetical protein